MHDSLTKNCGASLEVQEVFALNDNAGHDLKVDAGESLDHVSVCVHVCLKGQWHPIPYLC
jgi:hypothetical protein